MTNTASSSKSDIPTEVGPTESLIDGIREGYIRVLFLDNCNGFESRDPKADLVDIPAAIGKRELKALERRQPGAHNMGGSWKKIMQDGAIDHTEVASGKKSDFNEGDYDLEYSVISGNY